MKFFADLHIHSHFSLATSRDLTPEHLDYWAQLKGIDVVGTGDCTHPGWLAELREKLEPAGNGFYKLKKEYKLNALEHYLPERTKREVFFLLTGEISSIYKKKGKVRKVHNVCVLPSFDAAQRLQDKLEKLGNIRSDGRPILGVDAKDVLETVLGTDERSFVIPAHIWTPWFSVLGDKSGFDNLEECYEGLTKHIFAVETGLSSDPPMNWACSFLDAFTLVSNSDAHSPEKLGREANLFDTELSYAHLYGALKTRKGFLGTVEFFPQEGKYHSDGHRKCGVRWTPLETVEHNGLCPVCGKPVTKGVMYRVAELADRKDLLQAKNRKDFYSITSLPDLVSEITGAAPSSKKTRQAYFKVLETVGSDFYTLLSAPLDELKERGGELLAEGVRRMRDGDVNLEEGFDGEFGRITAFKKGEAESFSGSMLFESGKERTEKRDKISIKFDIEAFKKTLRETSPPAGPPLKTKDASANDEQAQAIQHAGGPCLVIAGPGSGKTHILTERIVRLINEEGVPQEEILAVTFSNKAADEIRSRVGAKVNGLRARIATFHAFGLSVLKEHAGAFGRTNVFSIAGDGEKEALFATICPKKDIAKKLRDISAFKQGIYTSSDVLPFLKHYDEALQKRDAFDLDDLLYFTVRLFQDDPAALERYRRRCRRLLVDEFQDINAVQYELVRLLAGTGKPELFVIGDPDQAIYGFRGSDVRFIDALQKDYPGMPVLRLSKSFRCPSTVLAAAGQVLGHERPLEGSPLDIKVEITECETDKSEADLIASQIEKMIGGVRSFSRDSGISDGTEAAGVSSFSDFAVLCRAGFMFEPLMKALADHGIPAVALDTESFLRSDPFARLLKDFKAACFQPADAGRTLKAMARVGNPVSDILAYLAREEGLPDQDAQRFADLGSGYGSDYTGFFRDLMLRKGVDDLDPRQEAVRVMTLHASKGLEFKAVFIPGCEEGIIPFQLFGKKTEEELEEEKRLLYVGATRTKSYLFLSFAKKRLFRGRTLSGQRSGLLDHLEKTLLNEEARKPKKRDNQLGFSFLEE